jgi:hypothetical protein
MRLITAALLITCTSPAQAQSPLGWYRRVQAARDAAMTAQADAEVMTSDAVVEFGWLRERVFKLWSAGALTAAEVDAIDLAGEHVRQWELHHAIVASVQTFGVAESSWRRAWSICEHGQPGGLVLQFEAARVRYEDTLGLSVDSLEWIEAKNHWLDDHMESIADDGWH